MKGKVLALLVALAAAEGLGIMPRGREMESLRLVTALAVDGGEQVSVTALTGVRVSEGEEPEVFHGAGNSLAQACKALREGSARRAYLGQTEQLLVGERQDVRETLEFICTDRELRMDTLLYIIRGEAGQALADSSERTAGETGGKDPRGRTVGETLARMEEGEHTLAPALAAGEEGLAPAGWAVLGPDGVEGFLEGEAAVGASLLAGQGEQVVTLPGGAVEVTGVRCRVRDGVLRCVIEGRRAQGEPRAEDLSAWGEAQVRAALGAGWDCWGLDRELGALRPWDWDSLRGYDVSKLDVKVEGRLVDGDGT